MMQKQEDKRNKEIIMKNCDCFSESGSYDVDL